MTSTKMSIALTGINFPELEHIYSNSISSSDGDRLNLNQAVLAFLEENPDAMLAQHDKDSAWQGRVSIVKGLCKYLEEENDFNAVIVVGIGLKKAPLNPCKTVNDMIKGSSALAVAHNLRHGAVRVDNIVIDLTHLCLGSKYLQTNNCTFKEFQGLWVQVEVGAKHLVDVNTTTKLHVPNFAPAAASASPVKVRRHEV